MKTPKNLTGQKFGELTALEMIGKDKENRYLWECSCSCGGKKICTSKKLQNGDNKRCDACGRNKVIDYTNKRFGRLLVLSSSEEKKYNRSAWNCVCDCGTECIMSQNELQRGAVNSCGCTNYIHINYTGQRFGRLVVIEKFEKDHYNHWYYKCKCDCGKEMMAIGYHLKNGNIKSCGCLRSEILSKLAKKRIGELNTNWHGGTSDEDQRARGSNECRKWRETVLDRDKHTCQICGCKERLEAHHLDGWNVAPDKRFDVNNGVTIDGDCHDLFHSLYGNGGNTSQQFESFKRDLGL